MGHRASAIGLAVALVAEAAFGQAPAQWTVGSTPLLTLGESVADTNDMFSQVVGASRLPDGRIVVGDYPGSYALRMFSPTGRLVRRFGRQGAGPGEIEYLIALFRCGDSLITRDISSQRVSVFSLSGDYVRSFRFGSPQPGRPPYRSACNRRGDFVHYGWEVVTDIKDGPYRPTVPLWISGADPDVRLIVGTTPGSERYGFIRDGRPTGSGPMPLGKHTLLAASDDRIYVGSGDGYEIAAYDLRGRLLSPVRQPRAVVSTTDDDIAYSKARAIAVAPAGARAGIERGYATMTLPSTIPAYAALIVDTRGQLWVQDYPRTTSPTSSWSVFDNGGRLIATAALPTYLELYEIGDDYVLGRYLDPDESIPQVRLYRLNRAK